MNRPATGNDDSSFIDSLNEITDQLRKDFDNKLNNLFQQI